MEHIVPITNGQGSLALVNGNYTITSTTGGYDDTTITPATQEITTDVNSYAFTIGATGTLTLHASDDGTEAGVPIVGATFVRCDASGNTHGDAITSDASGNAVFNHVPYAAENAPVVYYKQTASDGQHNYDAELLNTTLTAETVTVEITNAEATSRAFTLTDANYSGLPLADGNVVLTTVA
jgi:hypothetical protein